MVIVKKGFQSAYYLIIPILIIGISLGFTSFDIALFALLPLLFLTNRHTVGLFFLMYGGPLGGVIRAIYPMIPTYGLLIELCGILLIGDVVVDLFRKNSSSLLYMAITLIIIGLFYTLGPMDEWADKKYSLICMHGLFTLFGYYAFSSSPNIDPEGLIRILLVAGICLIVFCIESYHLTPGNILDFNWFREQTVYNNLENAYGRGGYETIVNYQHIGMLVLFGCAIFLSNVNLKPFITAIYTICSALLILMSGCRQALFGMAIIMTLRFAVFRKSNKLDKNSLRRVMSVFIGFVLAFVVFYNFFLNLDSEYISSTLAEGDEGRQLRWYYSIEIFLSNVFWGSGLGGYHAITGYPWSHNFFLELLCETGLIGTILLLFILVIAFIKRKVGFLYINSSSMFYFLILSALFVRVMVSSDLRESIELYSAIFAIKEMGQKR